MNISNVKSKMRRRGLKVLRKKAREHGKVPLAERFHELAGVVCAESSDVNVFASAIHHRIVVGPASADHLPQVFGKEKWATGLWMKQHTLRNKGHFKLVQPWLPQQPTAPPPSPVTALGSRPGSSSDHLAPPAPVNSQHRGKRMASSVDVPDAKRQTLSVGW